MNKHELTPEQLAKMTESLKPMQEAGKRIQENLKKLENKYQTEFTDTLESIKGALNKKGMVLPKNWEEVYLDWLLEQTIPEDEINAIAKEQGLEPEMVKGRPLTYGTLLRFDKIPTDNRKHLVNWSKAYTKELFDMGSFEDFINEINSLSITIEDRVFYEDGTFDEWTDQSHEIAQKIKANRQIWKEKSIRGVYPVYCLSYYSQSKHNHEAKLNDLQQRAITDILDKTPEQINRHIQRLKAIQTRLYKAEEETTRFYLDEMKAWEFERNVIKGKFAFDIPQVEGTQPQWTKPAIAHLLSAIIFKQGYLSGFINEVGSYQKNEDEAKDCPTDNSTNGKATVNKFNRLPIEEVRNYFMVLTKKKNNSHEIWMTVDDLEIFLKRSFEGQTTISKPKINLGSGAKYAVVKLFHSFFGEAGGHSYEANRRKKPYVDLLKNAFETDNFNDLIDSNFKSDKSIYEWK